MLYTKYRPKRFSQVLGQPASKGLRNLVIRGDPPHALLLTGPRGTGKTTLARIFARAINCENFSKGVVCGGCVPCTSPDYLEADAGAYSSKSSILKLRSYLQTSPRHKYRIAIIDESHAITSKAQTSFLKMVEEPPSQSIIIFLTTEPDKLSKALKSRCSWWPLRSVDLNTLMTVIAKVCRLEGVRIEKDAARIIARESDGSVRTALSLLESILAYNQSIIKENLITWVLSVADVGELVDNIMAGDMGESLFLSETLCAGYSYSTIMYQLSKDLITRSHMMFEAGRDGWVYAEMSLFFEEKRRARNVISEVAYMQVAVVEAVSIFGDTSSHEDLWASFQIAVSGGVEIGMFSTELVNEVRIIDARVRGKKVFYKSPFGEKPTDGLVQAFDDFAKGEYVWRRLNDNTRRKGAKRRSASGKRKRRLGG